MANLLNESSRYLAANLVNLRKKLNLTQSKLSELSGVTRASIALIESGSSNPTLDVLLKLSGTLQVTIDELMSVPRAECKLIKSQDVLLGKKSKEGIKIRKILPDKTGAADIDEMILKAGMSFVGSPHVEGTKEYFTCTAGEITVTVMGQIFKVSEGDVLTFPGDKPHSYKNSSKVVSRGFSVVLLRA